MQALAPIEDVIAVAERQAEAQWAWEHTACEHDDIVQTLAGATWCADCGQALGGITPR